MNIYVGNLSWEVSEDELKEAFEGHGQVASVNIITDKYTGRSRGFGFVEMSVDDEARAAIEALNNTELKGRNMNVNEARPRAEGSRGSGGGGGGGRSW
jgi:RNA recognition motif-containing protein